MENTQSSNPMRAPTTWGRVIERKDLTQYVALIDADKYKYLATYRKYQVMQDEGFPNDDQTLYDIVDSYLNMDLFSRFNSKGTVFCFSTPSSKGYRRIMSMEKEYKATRRNVLDKNDYDGKISDMGKVFRYIYDRYPTLVFESLEADDIVSFLQDEYMGKTFIVSDDKDLKQCPGHHYNAEDNELEFISEDQGFMNLMFQMLEGDTTDNIPGLFGCGPVASKNLLENKNPLQMVNTIIIEYGTKLGYKKGVDTFVEMWNLLSTKVSRGKHFKNEYLSAYKLIENLLDDD